MSIAFVHRLLQEIVVANSENKHQIYIQKKHDALRSKALAYVSYVFHIMTPMYDDTLSYAKYI